jgi:predicted aspartyl protease
MPSVSGRHNGRHLILDVALVGVSRDTDFLAPDRAPALSVFSEAVKALIDTGATSTSVSPQVVRSLGLRPSGKRDVLTANGLKRARFFEFHVAIIGKDEGTPPFILLPKTVRGDELNSDRFVFDILLGMDVISQGDLSVRRDGTFTFEF